MRIELFYIVALVPSIFPNQIFDFGLSISLPWTVHYISIWIMVALFALLAAVQCWKTLRGHPRFWVTFLAFTIPLGAYFASNPIYQGDFNKLGVHVNYDHDNAILQDVLSYKSDFEGLVCVASPSCPFCIEAVRDKIQVLHKRGKVDIVVYLPNDDGTNFKNFRALSQAQDVPIIGNSRPEMGFDIEENVIPVFLYIKDNTVIHVWRNDQLGYPALDWIESRLR